MKLNVKLDDQGNFSQLLTPTNEVIEGAGNMTTSVEDDSLYVTLKIRIDETAVYFQGETVPLSPK